MEFPEWNSPPVPATGVRADAARRIIDRLARADLAEADLAAAADRLENAADHLDSRGTERRYWGFGEAANAGDTHAFFDRSPLIGSANPLAVPIRVWVDGEVVRGAVTFGAAYEGPPGCVHGGFLAASFDEILGMTQSLGGSPGMTGTLTIRYRKPTPLHVDLSFEGRLDRVEGRKIFTRGTCHAGDLLTAEAEGIFISVDFTMFLARSEQPPPPGGGWGAEPTGGAPTGAQAGVAAPPDRGGPPIQQ
jgi:acyl-coenzyme A thioesterase PaaI-like protein